MEEMIAEQREAMMAELRQNFTAVRNETAEQNVRLLVVEGALSEEALQLLNLSAGDKRKQQQRGTSASRAGRGDVRVRAASRLAHSSALVFINPSFVFYRIV